MARRTNFQNLALIILILMGVFRSTTFSAVAQDKPKQDKQKTVLLPGTPTDHSAFPELQKDFKSGTEVTAACLTCHKDAGHQLQKNIHWTWTYHNRVTGQLLGKEYLINNFCTNARGNEGMCAQCHISYGAKNNQLPTSQSQIDCLVCHDQTGSYYRLPPTRGSPVCSVLFEGKKPFDWETVAQHVGLPRRQDCGGCHFYGGGGDNVKHGDLSSVLNDPPFEVDVHMSPQGQNFSCTACHVTKDHQWTGSRYEILARDTKGRGKPGFRRMATSCESCHGTSPHPANSLKHLALNRHARRVACQTCHISTFARGGVATRTFWDWRTAGRVKDGKGYVVKKYKQGNGEMRETYWSIKGSFKYGENVVPSYYWFNGETTYTTINTHFDPNKPVEINHLSGASTDPSSRIWPFKRMVTWQMFDKGNNTLVYTHLWADNVRDKTAYWGNYNLKLAVAKGMKDAGKPYSGKLGFIKTFSYWPITHMVAPKGQALSCGQCHASKSRLAGLAGVYIAGRDNGSWLDILGWLAVAAAIFGIGIHIILRFVTRTKGSAS